MLAARADVDEVLQRQAEAVLGLGRPELGDARLGADDKLELGDQAGEQLPARAQRGEDRVRLVVDRWDASLE